MNFWRRSSDPNSLIFVECGRGISIRRAKTRWCAAIQRMLRLRCRIRAHLTQIIYRVHFSSSSHTLTRAVNIHRTSTKTVSEGLLVTHVDWTPRDLVSKMSQRADPGSHHSLKPHPGPLLQTQFTVSIYQLTSS